MDARMSHTKRVAVIGAGWAGLAAAVELADRGIAVDVFEASRTLGGRARSVEWNGLTIDNGQHILIGAYTETLRLMRKVGVDPDTALMRLPLTLDYPGEFRMVAPRLPAPFHTACALAFAQGLDWSEKWAAIRLMTRLRLANWRIEPDMTVSAWLDKNNTPSRQRRLLWEPLCISALNTPAERASAQIMANVLRDSLGARREASDMLIPRLPLSECFPNPAAEFVAARGGRVLCGQRQRVLRREGKTWKVGGDETAVNDFDAVILAVAPQHLPVLLHEAQEVLQVMCFEPIVTTFLQYTSVPPLPGPMLGCDRGTTQWLFDRGAIAGQSGLIAGVISARGNHLDLSGNELATCMARDLAALCGRELPKPAATITVVEKRASYACLPAMRRLTTTTASDNLWLCGDHVAGDYPGTLEQAVRTGTQAARACANAFAQPG